LHVFANFFFLTGWVCTPQYVFKSITPCQAQKSDHCVSASPSTYPPGRDSASRLSVSRRLFCCTEATLRRAHIPCSLMCGRHGVADRKVAMLWPSQSAVGRNPGLHHGSSQLCKRVPQKVLGQWGSRCGRAPDPVRLQRGLGRHQEILP
jgi:hypothetical protein